MKKNTYFYLIIILIIGLVFNITSPKIDAAVWISPMNMLAEGNVTEDGTCQVQKVIKFKNDANKSAIVEITSSNITVLFENNSFELYPYEEKTIHPIIVVEQGKITGKILVKTYDKEDSNQTSGSKVSTTMVITVTSIGTLVNTSSSENNTEYKLDNLYYYILIVIIIGLILISLVLMKKKK